MGCFGAALQPQNTPKYPLLREGLSLNHEWEEDVTASLSLGRMAGWKVSGRQEGIWG
jgi:hypothetical protein